MAQPWEILKGIVIPDLEYGMKDPRFLIPIVVDALALAATSSEALKLVTFIFQLASIKP